MSFVPPNEKFNIKGLACDLLTSWDPLLKEADTAQRKRKKRRLPDEDRGNNVHRPLRQKMDDGEPFPQLVGKDAAIADVMSHSESDSNQPLNAHVSSHKNRD